MVYLTMLAVACTIKQWGAEWYELERMWK